MIGTRFSSRSRHPELFSKKCVLRNFAKYTEKYLCHSLFFSPATLLEKRLWHSCFPENFEEFLKTSFLAEYLWWQLLQFFRYSSFMILPFFNALYLTLLCLAHFQFKIACRVRVAYFREENQQFIQFL